jgi:hypothetical protein
MTSTSHVEPNPEKHPHEWVTADEPMTGPQDSYLHTLAQEAGESVGANLTKAEASLEIERLQKATGRGGRSPHPNGGEQAQHDPS